MNPTKKTIVTCICLFLFLTGVSPAIAGSDFEKFDQNQDNCPMDGKKCDPNQDHGQMDSKKCEGSPKQDEECAAYLKKRASELEEKSKQATGEEATIFHELSQCLSDGSAEKVKMARAKRNRDLEAYKKSDQACQNLMQKQGHLYEQLKKLKGEDQNFQKGSDLDRPNEMQKSSKGHDQTDSIESDSSAKRWPDEEGSSKK